MAYLAGFDVGSSSVKGSLIDADNGRVVASYTSPSRELRIYAPQLNWAQQNPDVWWNHVGIVSRKLLESADPDDVKGVGISYQMHGLVVVDRKQRVLYPSIIWCDGRTKEMGELAARDLGPGFLKKALNYPGNFTATKLAWLKRHEPAVYAQVHKAMLPGDYVAMKLTGYACTTPSGLSEGIMWDHKNEQLLAEVFGHFDIDPKLMPHVEPTFSIQGEVAKAGARKTGLRKGTPVAYRAGDQPNNALSLNVMDPGEAATTAGTSGVIYAVTDRNVFDPRSRVNVFVHVNHSPPKIGGEHRHGVLACVNGTGSMYRYLRDAFKGDYDSMNRAAAKAEPGCKGVMVFPFGNGPERILDGGSTGMGIYGLNFNVHGGGMEQGYVSRASQEGIVFALKRGSDIMGEMGAPVKNVRAGIANMFKSRLFGEIFAGAMDVDVELMNTDGSAGAARGAGIGTGEYRNRDEAFAGLKPVRTIHPDPHLRDAYGELYPKWLETLGQRFCEGK